jgi:hypothetical protein
MATKDRVVSPARNRQFFDKITSKQKVKEEFDVGHEILANEDINKKVIQAQIDWL